ncbi:MAG TPA: zinc ribbon domain-containing protein [Candidatus Altiarchaeales archaeon]|nr:zinc ribbon domain-containing protein [Candidatus Altiarchaeales archaeon]
MDLKQKAFVGLFLVLSVLFFTAYFLAPDEDVQKTFLYLAGATTVIFSLASGLAAVVFSIGYALWIFVITLPVISIVWGFIAYIFLTAIKWTFSLIFRKILGRMPAVQRMNKRFAESPRVISSKNRLDRMLERMGFNRPVKYQVVEVDRCPNCRSWKPSGGNYCPECGKILT